MGINKEEIEKYEQHILDEFIKMELNIPPEYNIESVSLMFTRISEKQGCNLEYDITADGTLIMHIYDLSIESGIKNALATFAYEIKVGFRLSTLRFFPIPVYYPIVTIAVTIVPVYLIALGNLLLFLLLGPLLFAILTLPVLLELTKYRMKNVIAVRKDLISSLMLSTIFSEEEIESYASYFIKHSSYRFLVDYAVFLPLELIYIWIMFVH